MHLDKKIIVTIFLLFILCASIRCQSDELGRNKDDTWGLTSKSIMGSTVLIASFDGNSASKEEDCKQLRDQQNKLYPSREFTCDRFFSY